MWPRSPPPPPVAGRDAISRKILAASEVPDSDESVYCIGSFGAKINFFAQQNRALNLVWALYESRRVQTRQRVAVIGAGVTGLTVAVGLISHGCLVDVYEDQESAVPKQLNTPHRLAHPSINSWPFKPPEVTTRLPFLEWHVGQCNTVADDLQKQFHAICLEQKKHLKPTEIESRFLSGTQVDLVDNIATQKIMVMPNTAKPQLTYSCAIVAAGSGDEIPLKRVKTKKYWETDDLEMQRTKGQFKYYIVSGCGDGGLIDVLRIVHVDFRQGLLAFRAAAELYDTPVAKMIADAETYALEAGPHVAQDLICTFLESVYLKAADLLTSDTQYDHLNQQLVESLEKFNRIVFLTDSKWIKPFSPTAAPIHKLLLAHARLRGKVTYNFRGFSSDREGYEIGGHPLKPKSAVKLVVRHGADARGKLMELLKRSQVDELQAKQLSDGDFIAEPHWRDFGFPAMPNYPPWDPTSDVFIRSRLTKAQIAARLFDEFAEVRLGIGGYDIFFPDTILAIPAIAKWPLFGVETTSRLPEETVGLV